MITKPKPETIPSSPGSYQFKDAHGRVIYVGKAKLLRPRITSDYQPHEKLHTRTQQNLQEAETVERIQLKNDHFIKILGNNQYIDVETNKNRSMRLNFNKLPPSVNKNVIKTEFLNLEKDEFLENCFQIEKIEA